MKSPEELKNIAEVSGGVNHAIVKNAKAARNYSELCQSLANKATTDAKVRRMLLFCLFGIDKKTSDRDVRFTKVLAMTDSGQKLLSDTRKQREIIIAGKASNVKPDKIALNQYNISENARRILYSCRQSFAKED
jgi:predicted nucleotidyltransferase